MTLQLGNEKRRKICKCGSCYKEIPIKEMRILGNNRLGYIRWYHLNCYASFLKEMKQEYINKYQTLMKDYGKYLVLEKI